MKRFRCVELKPAPEPEALFGQHTGYARFAYNWALGSSGLAWKWASG